jgi:hypothetical protein
MSIKSSLLKIAIKMTPNILIVWVSNFILKGIVELTEFNFDVDAPKLFVQIRLTVKSKRLPFVSRILPYSKMENPIE